MVDGAYVILCNIFLYIYFIVGLWLNGALPPEVYKHFIILEVNADTEDFPIPEASLVLLHTMPGIWDLSL